MTYLGCTKEMCVAHPVIVYSELEHSIDIRQYKVCVEYTIYNVQKTWWEVICELVYLIIPCLQQISD